jgi:hypothetical protein
LEIFIGVTALVVLAGCGKETKMTSSEETPAPVANSEVGVLDTRVVDVPTPQVVEDKWAGIISEASAVVPDVSDESKDSDESKERIPSDLEKTLGEFERKTLLLRFFMGLGE